MAFKIQLQKASPSNIDQIQKLFVETIETICKRDYTENQIRVWTAATKSSEKWMQKIKKQFFIIAEDAHQIIGFASLGNNYLDLLYIHKDFQRKGIAQLLYNEIEKQAIEKGIRLLISDVSITAKPFFEKQGFSVQTKQKPKIDGIEIINFKMTKSL